uniref:Phosphoribosylglycinamide formyltransferase n=1 Tax=Myotis myotis TaxID=51298 RepID=A0A7J7ZWC6_MYOMY|nr:phosphoribosylglycinamide formyltransferase [Myotis myotis]
MAARVLVIGNGGREHTLAWKLAQSRHVKQVLVAPGNAGTADSGKISNTAISVSDHSALAQFCKEEDIEFVVVGPEAPLAAGKVCFCILSLVSVPEELRERRIQPTLEMRVSDVM